VSLHAWNWRHAQLLPEQQAIRRPPGLRFDLGGMGKGWTVDRTADLLHGQGPYLVNAGGDLYAAGKPDGKHGWTLYLEHPWQPQCWIAQVELADAALATSTVTKRRWRQDGIARHHLIDPRNGRPAQTDVLAVSTIAKRTAVAEVLAKAALLLGADDGLDYLAHMPDVDGLLVRSDGKVLYTAGFEARLVAVDERGRCLAAA
jgi:thiamine biosynthesis lipoprotein